MGVPEPGVALDAARAGSRRVPRDRVRGRLGRPSSTHPVPGHVVARGGRSHDRRVHPPGGRLERHPPPAREVDLHPRVGRSVMTEYWPVVRVGRRSRSRRPRETGCRSSGASPPSRSRTAGRTPPSTSSGSRGSTGAAAGAACRRVGELRRVRRCSWIANALSKAVVGVGRPLWASAPISSDVVRGAARYRPFSSGVGDGRSGGRRRSAGRATPSTGVAVALPRAGGRRTWSPSPRRTGRSGPARLDRVMGYGRRQPVLREDRP